MFKSTKTVYTALLMLAALRSPLPAANTSIPFETSFTGTLGYDDNIYLASIGPLADQASIVSSIAAKIAAQTPGGLTLTYNPAATQYWSRAVEDNIKHLTSAAWKNRIDDLSWTASTELTLVDGANQAVDYAGASNAFSGIGARERRDNFFYRSDFALRYDHGPGFVRGVGKLTGWDMLTKSNGPANYVDRYDIQGGFDLGRAYPAKGPDYFLGYRRGYQYQDNDFDATSRRNASNRYHRYLAGLDGKLTKDLKISSQAGWAIHHYSDDPKVFAGDSTQEGLFTDITLTWAINPQHELQLKTLQARGVSSGGTNAFLNSAHSISWKQTLDKKWSSALTARLGEREFAPSKRDDLGYLATASLTWTPTAQLSYTATFAQDWLRNHHNGITGATEDARSADRSNVSLGATWKW